MSNGFSVGLLQQLFATKSIKPTIQALLKSSKFSKVLKTVRNPVIILIRKKVRSARCSHCCILMLPYLMSMVKWLTFVVFQLVSYDREVFSTCFCWRSHLFPRSVKSSAQAETLSASEALIDVKNFSACYSKLLDKIAHLIIVVYSRDLFRSLSTIKVSLARSILVEAQLL